MYFLVSVLFVSQIFGQVQDFPQSRNSLKQEALVQSSSKDTHLSARTKQLVRALEGTAGLSKSDTSILGGIVEEYSGHWINRIPYIGALIKTDPTVQRAAFELNGGLIGGHVGNIWSVQIPLNQFIEMTHLPGIQYIEIDQPLQQNLNNARNLTQTDEVHLGTQLNTVYSGKDVIVGIIDSGFDYTHPMFYDSTYSRYRIKRVWEQDKTGTPPDGFGYGRELKTATVIQSAGTDDNTNSHGTHVTGIAAGSGVGTQGQYMGMAPESDIVLVSTQRDPSTMVDGIAYILQYATSVGKPAVINISIGGQLGPHDGTSLFDQFCDDAVGDGKILVGSAGNDGSKPLHLMKVFTATDSVLGTFIKFTDSGSTDGFGGIDIWGLPNTDFAVGIGIVNANDDYSFADATYMIPASFNGTYTDTLYDDDPFLRDRTIIEFSSEASSDLNSKPHMTIVIDNSAQDNAYKWVYLQIQGKNTIVHSWGNELEFTDLGLNAPTQSGDTYYTVSETGGIGENMISVGAYTSKKYYQNFDGNVQTQDGTMNQIASFSSHGPTVDGRVKPDITAPGNIVVSSVNSFDTNFLDGGVWWSRVVDGITDGQNDWWFGGLEGTSMASPVVAGIVALMLEADPTLTPAEVKQILNQTAIKDNYTGSLSAGGNNTWGHGKIDALAALTAVEALSTSIQPVQTLPSTITLEQNYPNPFNPTTTIRYSLPTVAPVHLSILNLKGQQIWSYHQSSQSAGWHQVQWDGRNTVDEPVSSGVYFYQLTVGTQVAVRKLVLMK